MDMGVQDSLLRRELEANLSSNSEKLLQKFWEYEKRMKLKVQTDFIGIEYIMSNFGKDRVPTPVGVEMNSIECSKVVHLAEFLYPDSQGEAFGRFVRNTIARSQRFLMIGKTVLVIGAGGYNKQYFWNVARDCGIEVSRIA